jgi:hypothetical protein
MEVYYGEMANQIVLVEREGVYFIYRWKQRRVLEEKRTLLEPRVFDLVLIGEF